jgi:ferredoxin
MRYGDDPAEMIAEPGETVLDVLIRCRRPISYACFKGECMSCVVKCVVGDPPPESSEGLTRRMTRTGHFKACCCPADRVSVVDRPGS